MADSGRLSGRSKTSVFRCKYCGSTFVKADELIAHKKGNHLAEIIAAKRQQSLELRGDGSKQGNAKRPEQTTPSTSKISPKPASEQPPAQRSDRSPVGFKSEKQENENNNSRSETTELEARTETLSSAREEDFQPIISIGSVKTLSNSHTDDSIDEGFNCPECNITFNYDYQLVEHMSKHENKGTKTEKIQLGDKDNVTDKMELDTESEEEQGNGTAEADEHRQKTESPDLPPCYVVVTRLKVVDKEPPLASKYNISTKITNPRRHMFGHRSWRCKYKYCNKRFQRLGAYNIHMKAFHNGVPAPTYPRPKPKHKPAIASESADVVPAITSLAGNTNPIPIDSESAEPVKSDTADNSKANPEKYVSLPFIRDPSSKYCRYKCISPGCRYATRCRTGMQRHARHHILKLAFECHLCNATFGSKFGRALHLKCSHANDNKGNSLLSQLNFKLPTKPKTSFNAIQRKKEKYRKERIPDGLPHPCSNCSLVFESTHQLKYHRSLHHTKSKVKCDYCPYESFRGNVNMHMLRLHKNRHGKKHECKYCGARCSNLGVLVKHIALVHENNKSDSDDIEEVPPETTTNLLEKPSPKSHKSKEKPWVRNWDSSKGRRIFDCPHCPYKAFNTSDVYRHIRNIHTTQRRYQCEHCSASYDAERYLELHKILHSRNSAREASPGPKIVSVTSGSANSISSSSIDDESLNVKALVRSTRPTKSMAEPDSDSGSTEDQSDSKKTVKSWRYANLPKKYKCKICGLGFRIGANLYRHNKCENHLYNENIHRRSNGLPLLKNAPLLKSLRCRKVMCDICNMVFPSWQKVDDHKLKIHGLRTKTTKPKLRQVAMPTSTSRSVTPRTAVVQSQPRLVDKRIQDVNSSATVNKFSPTKNSPAEIETQVESLIWGKESNSFFEKTEFMDTSVSPDGKKAVSVTQQNKSGLKITTVRYTN